MTTPAMITVSGTGVELRRNLVELLGLTTLQIDHDMLRDQVHDMHELWRDRPRAEAATSDVDEKRDFDSAIERQQLWEVIEAINGVANIIGADDLEDRWRELPDLLRADLERDQGEIKEFRGRADLAVGLLRELGAFFEVPSPGGPIASVAEAIRDNWSNQQSMLDAQRNRLRTIADDFIVPPEPADTFPRRLTNAILEASTEDRADALAEASRTHVRITNERDEACQDRDAAHARAVAATAERDTAVAECEALAARLGTALRGRDESLAPAPAGMTIATYPLPEGAPTPEVAKAPEADQADEDERNNLAAPAEPVLPAGVNRADFEAWRADQLARGITENVEPLEYKRLRDAGLARAHVAAIGEAEAANDEAGAPDYPVISETTGLKIGESEWRTAPNSKRFDLHRKQHHIYFTSGGYRTAEQNDLERYTVATPRGREIGKVVLNVGDTWQGEVSIYSSPKLATLEDVLAWIYARDSHFGGTSPSQVAQAEKAAKAAAPDTQPDDDQRFLTAGELGVAQAAFRRIGIEMPDIPHFIKQRFGTGSLGTLRLQELRTLLVELEAMPPAAVAVGDDRMLTMKEIGQIQPAWNRAGYGPIGLMRYLEQRFGTGKLDMRPSQLRSFLADMADAAVGVPVDAEGMTTMEIETKVFYLEWEIRNVEKNYEDVELLERDRGNLQSHHDAWSLALTRRDESGPGALVGAA